jgi:hypothetical protein
MPYETSSAWPFRIDCEGEQRLEDIAAKVTLHRAVKAAGAQGGHA